MFQSLLSWIRVLNVNIPVFDGTYELFQSLLSWIRVLNPLMLSSKVRM